MDVNNLRQNSMNLYSKENNMSGYSGDEEIAVIKPIENIEEQSSLENRLDNGEYKKEELDEALKKINNFLKDEKTHAEYSVHEDFGTVMIKIINEETKEVILEVPPKKILDIVASMCKQVGLLDKKA